MKVLIIDDDKETRKDILLPFWTSKGVEVTGWLERWPTLFLEILQASPVTHISFDHDLGHTDVSVELNRMLWRDPEGFAKAFKGKHILIHSMNTVGAGNIAAKLSPYVDSIIILPLHAMREK